MHGGPPETSKMQPRYLGLQRQVIGVLVTLVRDAQPSYPQSTRRARRATKGATPKSFLTLDFVQHLNELELLHP